MAGNNGVSLNGAVAEVAPQAAADEQALTLTYDQVIGRDPTTAELTLGLQQLQDGASLSSERSYLATTGYAAVAISGIYTDVVGRAVTAPELTSDESYVAGGGSLVNLRGYLAASNEAASKLQFLYADVVGRPITPGELGSDQAALGAGIATLAGLRSYFATTTEAAGKLQTLYQTELDRPITSGELTADQQLIANGSSLAAIRGYLATSAEAVRAFGKQYQNAFGSPPAPADVQSGEQALASGASVSFAVASTASSVSFINAVFTSLLGVAPSAGEVGAAEDRIATAIDVPTNTTYFAPQATGAVTAVAAASPEFASAINAAFQAALGRPANAVELAADQSELGLPPASNDTAVATVTVATLKTQIAELSGGAPPQAAGSVQITGETIAGSSGYIYGLLNNDALISAQGANVGATLIGPGNATVYPFDPARDILQIETRQAASFGALSLSKSYDSVAGFPITTVKLGSGTSISLDVLSNAPITAANFRFV